MKKFDPNKSYERRLEQKALRRKRSRGSFNKMPRDFSVRLAIGEIQNLVKECQQVQSLVERSRFSIESRLKESLERIYSDSAAEIAEVLKNEEVSEALKVAELVSKVSTFEN